MKSEFIEIVSTTGEILRAERHEQLIPVGEIEHSTRFQDFCRSCPRFGKNLACPPHSPAFPDFLGKTRTAMVICFRVPLPTPGSTNLDQQRIGLRQAGRLLSAELKRYREQGYKAAGAGSCRACETCAAEEGDEICRKPLERIHSLESMGVDVGNLLKQCFGFALEWNKGADRAGYLCAVGAVFRDDDVTASPG